MKPKSIKYNGKTYTVKDIPKCFLKKYRDPEPLEQWIAHKIRGHKNYLKNKEARNQRSREDYINKREYYRKLGRERYNKQRDELLAQKKEYYNNNRDIILKKAAEYRMKPEIAKKSALFIVIAAPAICSNGRIAITTKFEVIFTI